MQEPLHMTAMASSGMDSTAVSGDDSSDVHLGACCHLISQPDATMCGTVLHDR